MKRDDELSTLLSVPFDPTMPSESSYHLDVVAGPDVGSSLVVDDTAPSALLVGTSPVCGLRLADRAVSRRHFSVEAEETRLRVVDLGSKNGTHVDELLVRDVALGGGERIVVGQTTIVVRRGPARSAALGSEASFGGIVGGSREMRRLFPLFAKLAASDIPVLVEGETGTGKRLLAVTLHVEGGAAGTFAELDASGITDATFDAELAAAVSEAAGGTLFVDAIGELSLACQAKLVRIFERAQPNAMRVIASTRHDLDEAAARGRFREDLYHWLAVGRVALPPLRARRGDVPLLVAHFCRELGGDASAITKELLATWQAHRFPGNVRELRGAVAKRLALGELAELPSSAPAARDDAFVAAILAENLPLVDARTRVVEAFERRYVEHMLRGAGGNVSRAAAASGVARRYFQVLKAKRGF